MPKDTTRVIVFGSGNVATSLGRAWESSGVVIAGFCNRAGVVPPGFISTKAPCFKKASEIDVIADYALIAVRDDVIFPMIDQLPQHLTPIHFSGAQPNPRRGGVIWCAQSVQPNNPGDAKNIPMIVTSNEEAISEKLMAFAKRISSHVLLTTEENRQKGHLIAVFAVNFTNHALAVAHELSEQAGIPWDWFVPMIDAMSKGAMDGKAYERQTGPGLRGEDAIISSQLKALKAHPTLQELYKATTASIQNLHDKPKT
ncbi:MAG: hypothetical protein CL845_00900 [Crocinitomicaceae bacterium]|nr:hypothetical protein [Crocinitomicaceae bacterium]